ncbi:MAG: bifunctional folylpolyglutamate synthase/dihydrofolate synthase [Ruminococcaceae bacterium]|nr:bifunctional folylpolyglutamate synthase/dihydrofolate synthase [Oscillospiraceae bacterium]
MNYKESMEYLKRSRRFGSRPGLERITELCERLGNPQEGLRFIHVTGTNGKGSVCSMLYSTLRFAGMKVGLFTSPYMLDFSERFICSGVNITRDEIASIVTEVAEKADLMEDTPTEFELLTAMSFLFFRKRECDIIVYEAGMGGRLDSTNIIPSPDVAVITGIALDHTEVLGSTVADIAFEKAGIIKPGSKVVCGEMPEEAAEVIRRKAAEVGAPVTFAGRGTSYEVTERTFSENGASFSMGERTGFSLPLAGLYQFANASVAIAVLDSLDICGKKLPDLIIKKGLARAKWRGRFELFRPDPVMIFDGGHNPQGVMAVAQSLAVYYPDRKFTVISGVMGDKDHSEMCRIMSQFAIRAYTVTPDNPRAMDAKAYAKELCEYGIDATPCDSMEDALALVTDKDTIVLGSLYMYKQFIEALGD